MKCSVVWKKSIFALHLNVNVLVSDRMFLGPRRRGCIPAALRFGTILFCLLTVKAQVIRLRSRLGGSTSPWWPPGEFCASALVVGN